MEELNAIDTSAAESLEALTSELETVLERLKRLEERRGQVSQEVYERVHADYQSRKDSLETEIAPLREEVLRQYSAVEKSLETLEETAHRLALEKEEVDLRHDLDELDDETYAGRISEVQGEIDANNASLSEARRLRNLFVLALREEPETAPASANTSTQPLPELDQPESYETPAVPFPEADAGEATVAENADAAGEPSQPGDTPAGQAAEETYSADATVFIQWPKLVGQAEDGSTVEYPVAGSRTTLGRDPENDIALSGKKVSKNHAEIVMVEDGYEIRDMDSTAGTLVNGVQITSWKLSNGDSVQLGDVVLVFMET